MNTSLLISASRCPKVLEGIFFCPCKYKHCPQNPKIYSNDRQQGAKTFPHLSRAHALLIHMPLDENGAIEPIIYMQIFVISNCCRHHFETAIPLLNHP
jgi:hypothetical protein